MSGKMKALKEIHRGIIKGPTKLAIVFAHNTTKDVLRTNIALADKIWTFDDPKKNRFVSLRAFADPKHHAYCPVKLILALSLRVGNVMGSSIEAVLSEVARRRDKTVGWLNPDWPLLPTTNSSSRLMLEMPLSVDGMTSTVTRAGRLAGIIGHINTTTCLLSVPGVATASPTMAAAHTFQSMAVFHHCKTVEIQNKYLATGKHLANKHQLRRTLLRLQYPLMYEKSVARILDFVGNATRTRYRQLLPLPPVDYKALCRGEEGFETAWNQKTLDTCDRLESNAVVTKIAKVVTNQVSCVLDMDQITPQYLRSRLPERIKRHLLEIHVVTLDFVDDINPILSLQVAALLSQATIDSNRPAQKFAFDYNNKADCVDNLLPGLLLFVFF
ncbi:hypothetical protein BDR22DRAFT_969794 [Usnea florida]